MIPQLASGVPGAPLEPTRLYVGRPTMPAFDESPSVGRYLGWSEEQILAVAEHGARDGDDLGAAMVEVVCAAYVSLVQDSGPRDEEFRQLRTQLSLEQQLNARLRYELAELTGDTLVVAL